MCAVVNYVHQTLRTIEMFRNNDEFKNRIQNKHNFIKSKNDEFSFTPLPMNRVRFVKELPEELS